MKSEKVKIDKSLSKLMEIRHSGTYSLFTFISYLLSNGDASVIELSVERKQLPTQTVGKTILRSQSFETRWLVKWQTQKEIAHSPPNNYNLAIDNHMTI